MAKEYKDVFYKFDTEDGPYYGHQLKWREKGSNTWSGESEIRELFIGEECKIYNISNTVSNSYLCYISLFINGVKYIVGEYYKVPDLPEEYRFLKYGIISAVELEEEIDLKYNSADDAKLSVIKRIENRRIMQRDSLYNSNDQADTNNNRINDAEKEAAAIKRLKKIMK